MQIFSEHYNSDEIEKLISEQLFSEISSREERPEGILFMCIGTDRSTGDCFGPLVGTKISSFAEQYEFVEVLGTLSQNVNAKNIEQNIKDSISDFPNHLVVAIDASLGKEENIGKINVYRGPLHPGSGVGKNLPIVGEISVTAIVNISGFMEYMVLQSTRLSIVMSMADKVCAGISSFLEKYSLHRETKVPEIGDLL